MLPTARQGDCRMGRYTTKRWVFIVAFVIVFLFSLAFVFSQYISPYLESSSSTSTPESKDITISYSVKTADNITTKYGDDVQSDSGKYFLIVDMTIKNNGYDGFNTYPYLFHAIADNIKYDYYYNLVEMENWDVVDVRDGGTFHGTLVFQLPESASSFTLGYDAFQDYNIIWNKI